MDEKIMIHGIVDVPYNFTDDRGNPRSGSTRKAFVVEYDLQGIIHSASTVKCAPDFMAELKVKGCGNYDKYGRLTGFTPDKK